jgi:hypothetical protein
MPNHVTNILSFAGPQEDIQNLRTQIKSIDEKGTERLIDFDKIIPMPPSLNITSGSEVDKGIAILKFTEQGDDSNLRAMLNYPWVKAENITTPQQLVDYFLKKDDGNREYLKEARIALDNAKNYGHKDWYSWSVANWGTKWNAYDTAEQGDSIRFDTAWSTPAPIVEKLSNMFPNVTITLEFADEDFGYNCGSIVFLAGNVIEENIPQGGSAEAYALASKIQATDVDSLMYSACESEDEKFIVSMVNNAIAEFDLEELICFLKEGDVNMFSETFLETLKNVLIELEAYEHIGVVDELINQKVGEN